MILALITLLVALRESEGASDIPDPEPMAFETLKFRNVRFQYPGGDRRILDGLSFTLTGGLHYAFVGKNGAGKITINKLLTGLYTEYEGEILVNGVELRQYPASTLKALFSVVHQDFAKYHIALKDNIALGDAAGTDTNSRISVAAAQAGLGEAIAGLKNGLETPLGKILDGGQDISGGQWQRLAIARGLYRENGFIVLDEPTSAIDPIEEIRIYTQFRRLAEGKCAVVVTHRIGSAKLAHRIVVMDGGQIVDTGTHEEFLPRPGKYADMWAAQAKWYKRLDIG